MMYQFSLADQLLIAAGKYVPVISKAGVPLSIVRNAKGQFAAHAVGAVSSGASLHPLVGCAQMAMGAGQMYQNHVAIQGIKALSASVATLQATTAVIGVGVAATVALSAVNLWQTLKLREDVRQLRIDVHDGFIDLKHVLSEQENELTQHIQQVSEDVTFQSHRTILVRAYGRFEQSMDRLQSAVLADSLSTRHDEITAARDMMFSALSDYKAKALLEDVGAIAYLRRRECVWAIEQAIAMTYQMQGEWKIVSDRLLNLDKTMRQDVLYVLDQSETDEELDFLFPEITRIHNHDLAAIEVWKGHTDWYQELSPEEIQQLNEFIAGEQENTTEDSSADIDDTEEKPAEYEFYKEAKQKFASRALRGSLILLFDSERRQDVERYISERAELEDFIALSPQNLSKASSLTVANLGLYFMFGDESLEEDETQEESHEDVVEAAAIA